MIFPKIFKIFLLFLLFGAVPQVSYGALYRLNERTNVSFSPTAELFAYAVMDYLREADLQLSKFFPKRPQKTDKSTLRKFRINISDEPQKKMSVSREGKNITVNIGSVSPSFQSDYNFLHQIFSAAALQVMPYSLSSMAAARVRPTTPALAAQYSACLITSPIKARLVQLIMRPYFCCFI